MRATVDAMRNVSLPTLEVEVSEWGATILLRALTRAQVRECREHAQIEQDGKPRLDLDTYDLAVLAASFADPQLLAEITMEEAVDLLRAQPIGLIWDLVRKAVSLSGLGPDAPFRSRTADHDRPGGVSGTSDTPGAGRNDLGGDAAEDEPA